ncbi:hypothetical protein KIN20_034540 [Parelaphostrongylus tenuis]|uniref:Uncharacterized protein n=1 Tax=Parelaphostrongylus tenuis TaxID=148309 RepID=A0AAD5RAJ1_PARTN|nr:hypothetical protein KIN20_034540 [Parelaphostrongylus tenuis]
MLRMLSSFLRSRKWIPRSDEFLKRHRAPTYFSSEGLLAAAVFRTGRNLSAF